MASDGFHGDRSTLSDTTIEMHRATTSLIEEFEAVDWYRQRADACADDALKQVLLHNMDEELEHAAMVLEWMRRNDARVDHHLGAHLFNDEPIVTRTHVEDVVKPLRDAAGRLPIRSLISRL